MASSWSVAITFTAAGLFCAPCAVEAVGTSQVLLFCSADLLESLILQMRVVNFLHELLACTPNVAAGNNNYAHWPPYRQMKDIYGHGECMATLSEDDCRSCMQVAYNKLARVCWHNSGAHIQLKDCQLRYEMYKFADNNI
ncbi:hypothetical protein MLD38_035772 [Melastoma candidum]|uniref:Uncharacterized protein n=1 Tax=Melastoma candidum TaxID=119954 RepID=A0ACB9LHU0_9MYRT|nr:hypothetical protein MLD38_035772 [Melastoma candidum]